jgi:hypothetical protein
MSGRREELIFVKLSKNIIRKINIGEGLNQEDNNLISEAQNFVNRDKLGAPEWAKDLVSCYSINQISEVAVFSVDSSNIVYNSIKENQGVSVSLDLEPLEVGKVEDTLIEQVIQRVDPSQVDSDNDHTPEIFIEVTESPVDLYGDGNDFTDFSSFFDSN